MQNRWHKADTESPPVSGSYWCCTRGGDEATRRYEQVTCVLRPLSTGGGHYWLVTQDTDTHTTRYVEYWRPLPTIENDVPKEHDFLIYELKSAVDALLEYIDAIPEGTVLPTMPGVDRDWVESLLNNTGNFQQLTATQVRALAQSTKLAVIDDQSGKLLAATYNADVTDRIMAFAKGLRRFLAEPLQPTVHPVRDATLREIADVLYRRSEQSHEVKDFTSALAERKAAQVVEARIGQPLQ